MSQEFPFPESATKDMMTFPAKHIWKVSEIIYEIGYRLERDFSSIWVEGEVSGLRRPSSGHLYFTLKDEHSQIKAVLFKSQAIRLPFELEDGAHVVCIGRLNIYPDRGDLQLIVDAFEHKGDGILRLAFEKLKERLSREGLFDPERKRHLPLIPNRVFVITSPTGAAIRDFILTARKRFLGSHLIICPTVVQGEGAAQEIIQTMNIVKAVCQERDVVLLTRGGGSMEDLWAFNDEMLAREIFNFPIPVVSAVGHEIDFTISDFVADIRAATPTAAAQVIFPEAQEIRQRINALQKHIVMDMKHRIAVNGRELHGLRLRLKDPKKTIIQARLRSDELTTRLEKHIRNKVQCFKERLHELRYNLYLHSPKKNLDIKRTYLNALRERLIGAGKGIVEKKRNRIVFISSNLNSISPLNVLSRGYSLVYRLPGKQILRNAQDVSVGERLLIRPHSGHLICEVKEVDNDE